MYSYRVKHNTFLYVSVLFIQFLSKRPRSTTLHALLPPDIPKYYQGGAITHIAAPLKRLQCFGFSGLGVVN